ncbi:MAG: hypothetical protein E7662_08105 [Ruminococcaceae bacterium]|nr:hypothetical protein [Oscillospiraceae bacterium]
MEKIHENEACVMTDIQKALANWRRILVILPDADQTDPAVRLRAAILERNAERALEAFKRDNPDSLFLDEAPTASRQMTQEFARIADIAYAWGSCGTAYYQREDILEIILCSLQWMYEHRYGKREQEGTGWRSTRLFNWHDWKLGSPEQIIRTLIILGDKVSPAQIADYLRLFDALVPEPRDYSSNKIHYAKLIIGSGLLQGNPERIDCALRGIEETNIYVDNGENDGQGFYTDGSYIFHTRHPMNGSYGKGHFSNMVDICRILHGTAYEDTEINTRLCDWAKNSFIPFVSKSICASCVLCRHPNNSRNAGMGILRTVCEMASFLPADTAQCFLLDVKRNLLANPEMRREETLHRFYSGLSSDALKALRKVMDDPSAADLSYDLNKVYYNEDRVVHHHSGVAYALAMSSSRIYNYESINHENMNGWYLGDGMLTAYADDFYAYSEGWNEADPYRRPGTTADTREREVISISQRNEYLSGQDFVGGVSDGKCGAAAMRLESYHGDGEHISKRYFSPDGAYGGPPAKRDCTLLAKKSWFFFDKIAVCLGCDISAHDDADVITVIDSRRTTAPLLLPDGSELFLSGEDRSLPEVPYLYLESFGGYWFPLKTDLRARRYNASVPFVEIIAHHGMNPAGGTYAYAMLPTYSKAETAAFAADPDVSILANTPEMQAVRHKDGRSMYVFWEAASFRDISVSAPVMLMTAGGRLYVSDPTHKLTAVSVCINGKSYPFDFTGSHGATLSALL